MRGGLGHVGSGGRGSLRGCCSGGGQVELLEPEFVVWDFKIGESLNHINFVRLREKTQHIL